MVLMRRLSAASWSPNYGVRNDGPNAVTIGGVTFRTGTGQGLTYNVDKDDREAIISSITRAKRGNDMVAFSIHAHEVATTGSTASVADFLPPLFHDAIDAGADIVLRHGPHALGGVEIYKGKPIFYGLNSLFFVVGGVEGALDPVRRVNTGFYDNMVAVTEFSAGKPSVVRIYPITTTFDRPATFGGSRIATGEDATRILARIQKESEPFGTQIKIENGIGVIRIPASNPTALTDGWLGQWNGPEGTFLLLEGDRGRYNITIRNLDGATTFQGRSAGSEIVFERNGMKQSIHATNGTATGMKWLAEKSNCLTVRPGEGYCRN
jgi:hypothetical protein